jgi:HEAT repeats
MSNGQKRWGAAGAALLLIGAGAWYYAHKGGTKHAPWVAESEQAASDRWRGFAAGTPGLPGSPAEALPGTPGWVSPEVVKQQVATALDAWRNAILQKNADSVVALDRAFAQAPARYGPALIKLADSDPEERVRAFSTRVLGKLRNIALTDIFQRLLGDKSPYVRQNAAWALGELVERPSGREAAQAAIADLRQIEQADPAQDVRSAANNALKRLQ